MNKACKGYGFAVLSMSVVFSVFASHHNPCTKASQTMNCIDNGMLSGEPTVSSETTAVCVGDTISFSLNGSLSDDGGNKTKTTTFLEGYCPDETITVHISPVTVVYAWSITRDGTEVASGSGTSASYETDQKGKYKCKFTGSADRECPPTERYFVSDEVAALKVEVDDAAFGAVCPGTDGQVTVTLTEDSFPQDDVTWELSPSSGGASIMGGNTGSSVTVDVGTSPNVYSLKVHADMSPDCMDSIDIVVGKETRIISFIDTLNPVTELPPVLAQYTLHNGPPTPQRSALIEGALVGLAVSANPTPPSTFTPSSWTSFVSTKEYRGYLYMQPYIICDSDGKALCYSLIQKDVSNGFTPIRGPSGTTYSPGTGSETLTDTSSALGCSSPTWHHNMRVGDTASLASALLLGVGAPLALQEILYTLCCNGTYAIQYSGSNFPSHYIYLDGKKVAEHIQFDLAKFMYAGTDVEAPGGVVDSQRGSVP